MTRRSERLSRVLRVREVQEEQARAVWLAAEGTARDAEDRAAALRAARAEMTASLGAGLRELPPRWVLLAHEAVDHVAGRAARQGERAETLRAQAEAARAPWVERRAAARGLERLVDRARARERGEELADEARVLDENTAARVARDRRPRRQR